MGNWSVPSGMVAKVFVLLLVLGFSAASDHKWRKAMMWTGESSSMMFDRVGSSVLLPVHGNFYPTGYYNTTIYVGQPSKPYFLDLDSGSDLTWLQCDAGAPRVRCVEAPHPLYRPSNDLVPSKDPLCESLHPPEGHKSENPQQCDYQVEYADGGSSLGVLVRDVFTFNYTTGTHLSPRLALGCGYDQLPGASHHPLDGILGLGKGKTSILSQLHSQGIVKNVVGHCLSGRGGGYVFFGDGLYDSSRIIWTSMSKDYPQYYSPGISELLFGGRTTGYKNLIVVFDSGSSYTYLNSKAYQALESLVRRELSGRPLKEEPTDQTLPICWKGKKPFRNVRDVRKYFKTIALSFGASRKTKSIFEMPPESYLIISNKGNVCLGILNGTQVGLNLDVIGDISMQDRLVIYDNEKGAIGWSQANCDQLPKLKSAFW